MKNEKNEMMKKPFVPCRVEVCVIENEDVLTKSGEFCNDWDFFTLYYT